MFGIFKKKITAAVGSISRKISGAEEQEQKEEPVKKEPEVKSGLKDETSTPAEEQKEGILSKITKTFTEKTLSDGFLRDALWELELALLENNVAQEVAEKITADIKAKLVGKKVRKKEAEKIIQDILKEDILEILDQPKINLEEKLKMKEGKPLVIAVIGFNGAGKTTSLAKIANYFKKRNHSCVFAAADSFRVAAIEQLEEHAKKLNVKMIKHQYGADPAAVIYDAIAHAEAKHIKVVLADTAGRVHTDKNLLMELEKIVSVNKPDLKFLVVEAIAGNDVVEQAGYSTAWELTASYLPSGMLTRKEALP